MRPIPKRLLPHQCQIKKFKGNTGEGEEWEKEKALYNVKIEDKQKLRKTNDGKEVVSEALLFYDCYNSNGLIGTFNQNDIIIFNGREYKVVDFKTLYATSSNPHHFEVSLK